MISGARPDASPRIFRSDALERLTRVDLIVPVVGFGPATAALGALALARMPATVAVGLAVAGLLFWTFAEYWLHRVVFHLEPRGRVGAKLHWLVHGVHHEHPRDRDRLLMPPAASVPLALAFFALFVAVLGALAALPFTAGFLTGYLAYDLTHYHLHHGRARGARARRLREQHMRHHFQDHTRGFGVSVTWWDRVFRTRAR